MRAIAILALTAVFSTLAAADDTAPATQGQARALENRWKNCSQVKSGRLGAFHPENDVDGPFSFNYVAYTNGTTYTGTYAPCRAEKIGKEGQVAYLTIDTPTGELIFFSPTDSDQIVTFTMSKKLNQPAYMEGVYTTGYTSNQTLARVVTNCGETHQNATVTKDKDGKNWVVTLTNVNACPRFPYTNEYMPAGGIAALVIILVTFVIQMAICAWYHKTHASADANPAEAQMH